MKYFVWISVALLVILHQDYWLDSAFALFGSDYSHWKDATLVFGFLPQNLVYHIAISIAAAVVWLLATKYCWPRELADDGPQKDREPKES